MAIYRRNGNLCAVQLLLGHAKIESTVRYLGIELDPAYVKPASQRLAEHGYRPLIEMLGR